MKLQLKFQKIVCYLVLVVCALAFVFSLGLVTDIYNLMPAVDWGIQGNEIFLDIQPFNRNQVNLVILMIIAAVFLFITRTNVRRKYYTSNYIATLMVVLINIAVSIWAIINVLEFKQRFLTEVDFPAWLAIRDIISDFPYTESTLWLDFNIITFILVILATLALLGNLIWKIMLMKYEDKLLSGAIKPDPNSLQSGV
ncbi:MAG: hypothetical protein PHX62_01025 [Bacilli bacterium]|nr:hypothetical protein [Bacilli bacterium]